MSGNLQSFSSHAYIELIINVPDDVAIVFIQLGVQDMSIIISAFKVSVEWYWPWPRQSYL